MKIYPLDDQSIEKYSKIISSNNEFFISEENELIKDINEEEDNLADFRNQNKKLGFHKNPGYAPDLSDYYEEYIKPVFKWTFWPWIVGLLLIFVFHCFIWFLNLIFDISWQTWEWTKGFFFWGLIGIAGLTVLNLAVYGVWYLVWYIKNKRYISWKARKDFIRNEIQTTERKIKNYQESLNQLFNNRERILLFAFRNYLGFPIKSLSKWNYKSAKAEYLSKKKQLDALSNSDVKNEDIIYKYYDDKLDLFYKHSIPVETESSEALEIFFSSIPSRKNNRMNREYSEPRELHPQSVNKLENQNKNFGERTLDGDIDKFEEYLNQDTSGFFTKHNSSLLQNQVEGLEKTYKNAENKVDAFNKVISEINVTLSLSRLMAFRNIYLGAELVNIIRENAGGGKATIQNDFIETYFLAPIQKMKNVNFTTSQAVVEMVVAGLDSIESFITTNISNKQFQNFAMGNPKSAALGALAAGAFGVINAGIEAWKKRNAKIEALLEKEKVIIGNMDKMVEGYLEQLKFSRRGIEVIQALSKVNRGFMAVYSPIYEKVFIEKDIKKVSVQELQQLCLALNQFNKLSQTKL